MADKYLYVREIGTDKEVHRIKVSNPTPRKLEKVLLGLLNRIDTDQFFIDDKEFDYLYA